MSRRSGRPIGPALVLLFAVAPAGAADIDPHRALYSLTLGSSAKSGSGVLGASGAMYYEWGETCDGWTVEQRFRLRTDVCRIGRQRVELDPGDLGVQGRAALPLQRAAAAQRRGRRGAARRGPSRRARQGRRGRLHQAGCHHPHPGARGDLPDRAYAGADRPRQGRGPIRRRARCSTARASRTRPRSPP